MLPPSLVLPRIACFCFLFLLHQQPQHIPRRRQYFHETKESLAFFLVARMRFCIREGGSNSNLSKKGREQRKQDRRGNRFLLLLFTETHTDTKSHCNSIYSPVQVLRDAYLGVRQQQQQREEQQREEQQE